MWSGNLRSTKVLCPLLHESCVYCKNVRLVSITRLLLQLIGRVFYCIYKCRYGIQYQGVATFTIQRVIGVVSTESTCSRNRSVTSQIGVLLGESYSPSPEHNSPPIGRWRAFSSLRYTWLRARHGPEVCREPFSRGALHVHLL